MDDQVICLGFKRICRCYYAYHVLLLKVDNNGIWVINYSEMARVRKSLVTTVVYCGVCSNKSG